MSVINAIWFQNHPLKWLLTPFSGVFWLLSTLRRFIYRRGWLAVYRAPVPVVVVGNISVGGNGKTPTVLAVVEHLKRQGWSPGVVSRGYGGTRCESPFSVETTTDPKLCGDEPLLIRIRSGCPVVVAPKRAEAITQLLADQNVDIVVSDDGLQHYAMARDVELVVVDGRRRHGNGWCLPAGPLRELPRRLQSVDLLLLNRSGNDADLAGAFDMHLEPQSWRRVTDDHLVDLPSGPRVAMAGIGHPPRFYQTLQQLGVSDFDTLDLGDHAWLTQEQSEMLKSKALLMTEKDALKYRQIAGEHWVYLPVEAALSTGFYRKLDQTIKDNYAAGL